MAIKALYLTTKNGFKFKVVKEVDDPLTNRLSIGGSKEDGCYIVYRGDTEVCREILEEALGALNKTNDVNKTQNN
jgi:hypothetical protein